MLRAGIGSAFSSDSGPRNGPGTARVTPYMALSGTYVPSKQQWVRDQVAEFEASDGARANTLRDTGYPIVVITSVGARSGNLRKNPVMRVERDGTYVAIASKGGADDHPEWYHNFLAHPEVELQDGADKHAYIARLAEGEERTASTRSGPPARSRCSCWSAPDGQRAVREIEPA